MKLSGIAGTGSGKLGSQVYASVAGEQIVRNYQPKVSNPNTEKQVNQRARMKLMSQLSAAMASVIVIPRQGMSSARNQFSKKNFANVQAINGKAYSFLEQFQLTSGNAALPRVAMSRVEDDKLQIYLMGDPGTSVDRIVYNLFARSEEGELMLINSIVVTDPGEENDYITEVPDYDGDLFVYAYGMKDTGARAKAKYGNYKVETGEDVAKLIATRAITTSDYTFTETQGNSITFDDVDSVSVPEGSVAVRFVFDGDGAIRLNTASGAVQQSPLVIRRGTQRKFLAVAAPGCTFKAWHIWDSNNDYNWKTDNPLTFTAWGDIYMVVECPENHVTPGSDE